MENLETYIAFEFGVLTQWMALAYYPSIGR